MALTSTTGVVEGSDVKFEITAFGNSRGAGVIAYVDYTKGAGDTLVSLFTKFFEARLSEDGFYGIFVNGTSVVKAQYDFDSTGKFRLPIPIASNEDAVLIEVSGLVDGDVNIEFSIDNSYQ